MHIDLLKTKLLQLDLSKYNDFKMDNFIILDAQKFVVTHISFLEANQGNETFLPYYDRILLFYNKLSL